MAPKLARGHCTFVFFHVVSHGRCNKRSKYSSKYTPQSELLFWRGTCNRQQHKGDNQHEYTVRGCLCDHEYSFYTKLHHGVHPYVKRAVLRELLTSHYVSSESVFLQNTSTYTLHKILSQAAHGSMPTIYSIWIYLLVDVAQYPSQEK